MMQKALKYIRHSIFLAASMAFAQQSPTGITLADIASDDDKTGLRSFIFSTLDKSSDMSYHFLSVLFGSIADPNSPNVIVSEIFRALNLGILSILSVIIGYTVVLTVISTAQDSSGAFSQRVSPWTLARVVGGASLMMPTASGYSAIQIIVMKIVMMGIGFANTAWVTVVNYNQAGVTMSVANSSDTVFPEAPLQFYVRDVAAGVINDYMQVCVGAKKDTTYAQVLNSCSGVVIVPNNGYYFIDALGARVEPSRQIEIAAMLEDSSSPGELTVDSSGQAVQDAMQDVGQGIDGARLAATQAASGIGETRVRRYTSLSQPTFTLDAMNSNPTVHSAFTALETSVVRRMFSLIHNKVQFNSAQDATAIFEPGVESRDPTGLARSFLGAEESKRTINQILNLINERFSGLFSELRRVYFSAMANVAPAQWHNDAKTKGWLSSGMYYHKLMDASSTQSSVSPINYTHDLNLERIAALLPVISAGEQGAKSLESIPRPLLVKLKDAAASIERLNQYTSSTDALFSQFLPPISGSLGGNSWIWGIDVSMPIRNMVKMVIKASQAVMGLNVFDPNVAVAITPEWRLCKAALDNAVDNGAEFNSDSLSSCVNPNYGLMSSFQPGYVDPIAASRSLGRQLITIATDYYRNTIRALYSELEDLAWAFYGTTMGVSLPADIALAAGYASPAHLALVAVKVATDIAVSGFKIAYSGTRTAIEMYVPLGTAFAASFLALGVIIGVYLPLLPFVLFLFGAVSWMMSVAEALVAAPLVALGVTHPEGHDLLGKSEQALVLLLGVFIRPITLLFGVLLAVVVSQVIFKVFNIAFAMVAFKVMADASGTSGNVMAQGIAAAGVMLVYIYTMMSVIEQSYSLIYQVPDRILRWIGGPQEQSMVGQLAEQAKGETQQAAGQVGTGLGSSTKGPDISAREGSLDAEAPESERKTEKGGSSVNTGGKAEE